MEFFIGVFVGLLLGAVASLFTFYLAERAFNDES